jgi:hypothetical protein
MVYDLGKGMVALFIDIPSRKPIRIKKELGKFV